MHKLTIYRLKQFFYQRSMGIWLVLSVLLFTMALTTAVAAQTAEPDGDSSDVQLINGEPLTVSIAQDGRYQMALRQDNQISAQSMGALYLWYDGCEIVPRTTPILGADLASWIPVSQSAVSGQGTESDPWQVMTQMEARCEDGLETTILEVESVVRYVSAADYFRLNLHVCGGQAGEPVETALLTENTSNEFLRADARAEAVFDETGCAEFRILWMFGNAPQAPLALDTLAVEAGSAPDSTSIIGFSLVGLIFLTLLCLWWVTLPPLRSRQD